MEDESYTYNTDDLIMRYPVLESCREDINKAYQVLENTFATGHKLLICGNGGSAADSEHIVGEMMKGFKKRRHISKEMEEKLLRIDPEKGRELADRLQGGLPCIALVDHAGLNTAFTNDVENGGLLAFAQQVNGYGKEGDTLLGISTSGNSKNVIYAAITAKAKGMNVVILSGKTGGKLLSYSDVCVRVPLTETFMIQELHLPIYHCLCLMLEERFF